MTPLNEQVVREEDLKKYVVHKQIGAGAQAKVYKIQKKNHHAAAIERRASPQIAEKANSESGGGDNTEKIYAIKVIVRDKLDQRDIAEKLQLVNEIHIQRALRYCGNTIKLLKIYESDRYLNLLLEYQEGGTLGDMLEKQIKISEEDARMIIAQLLLTLDFMERKKIIHRDLKPENILLHSKREGIYDIRIADFGFACYADTCQRAENPDDEIICGTPGYIAPEALEG